MSVFIGSTTPSQRACLSREFRKLYAKKTFIPRKQKIAIALNTCDVGIKGTKVDKAYLEYEVKGKKKRIFFPTASEAMKYAKQFRKNVRDGLYRETYSNIRIKTMI